MDSILLERLLNALRNAGLDCDMIGCNYVARMTKTFGVSTIIKELSIGALRREPYIPNEYSLIQLLFVGGAEYKINKILESLIDYIEHNGIPEHTLSFGDF